MKRIGIVLPLALVVLGGCDALTAHTAVAARAGSQELTTDRLAKLIGNSTVPLDTNAENNERVAFAVADVWVNYQLLGQAAARNDTMKDPKQVDVALEQTFNNAKAMKFQTEVGKTLMPTDTVATEAEYNQGDALAAAHILFAFPQGGGPPQVDSVKRVAEQVRKTLTTANFDDMVKKHSKDPGSVNNKGLYPIFKRGDMVKEFEDGVLALKPGEISEPIQTMHGFHIIRRPMFEEVKAEHSRNKTMKAGFVADSNWRAGIEKANRVEVKKNAPEMLREIAQNVEDHRNDRKVIATYRGGSYTAADFARLVRSVPQRAQLIQQIMSMPDSIVPFAIKGVVLNDKIFPRMADSAKLVPDSAEMNSIRAQLTNILVDSWRQLGIDPASLGDSAANDAARMKEAATRIDEYIDGLMSSTKPYIPVPEPLEQLVRSNYSHDIRESGLKRALQQARKYRASADSARALQMRDAPGSQVPMNPGGAPPQGRGGEPPASPPAGKSRGG